MAKLTWHAVGTKKYETGVDRGVLYIPNEAGKYLEAHAWNGLTSVSESPSGAEANPLYADNIKYLNLFSAEQFGATIEAYTYPDKFEECDGSKELAPGVMVTQQTRKTFGLSYRTLVGNDVKGNDFGYKIHLVYGAMASPSQKSRSTVNESPEAVTFSWEVTTTPVEVGTGFKPTAHLVIDTTRLEAPKLAKLEEVLYGSDSKEANLPLPADVLAIISGD